jgi:hypothetical protein
MLLRYLSAECSSCAKPFYDLEVLATAIRPFDVLLVEGKQRYSAAIKYLTQSNWSHAAIYIGNGFLIEAELEAGVIKSPLDKYGHYNTRICRPMDLGPTDAEIIRNFLTEQIGHKYDLKNITDLARYLLPTPPVPIAMRRSLLYFGSGDPTKAICSSMIAMAFQKIHYPILPIAEQSYFKIRHHSLFTPSDFDRSPYFSVVKPTIKSKFDYRQLPWITDID